jgi:Ca-activated chloride channel family protein
VIEGNADGSRQKFSVPVEFPRTSDAQPFVPRLWASRRVAYLLDEIRLHGENSELKDEATDLARQFGIVTPYTAYLIMEDEQGRHVAVENQVMKDFAADKPATKSAGGAYDVFQKQEDGVGGVSVARSQNDMKYAERTESALTAGNADASAAMNVPVAATTSPSAMPGNGYRTKAVPSDDANTRVVQYTQRAKYVAGRAFFQNGSQWVDSNVSKQNGGKNVRLKFGSDDYFALVANHPEARAWLSLGQNMKLVLGDTVYDIFDDVATN